MSKTLLESVILFLFALSLFAAGPAEQTKAEQPAASESKPGLLILTHGSPSPKWQESIAALAGKVAKANEEKKAFHAVAAANMEFAKPDAADGIETLEKAGCTRIIVVPAFIMPTGHTHFDVPASLGLYSSPSVRRTLKAENAKPAAPKVPVTVTETISEGDVLDKYVKDEIAALSENPEEEAVLLISHGDEEHSGLVEPVIRRLLVEAVGSKGITAGDRAFCEVGQSYARNVIPVIRHLAKEKKRVLVVGFYLVSSAKSIDRSGQMMGQSGNRPGGAAPAGRPGGSPDGRPGGAPDGAGADASGNAAPPRSPLDGLDVRFSERGVIEHPAMPQWVLQAATEAL